MTIPELQAALPSSCYLSDIWKADDENYLRISVYDFSSSIGSRSFYRCHFEIDYKGMILAVKNEHDFKPDLSTSYQHLVGTRIDLNSFEWYFKKEVKDSPSNMAGKQNILGLIKSGRFIPFTKRNAHQLKGLIRTKYRGNNDKMMSYGNYEYAKWFLIFAMKYRKQLVDFSITSQYGTTFRYTFQIGKKRIVLSLWKFFNYSLTATIGKLTLKNEEIEPYIRKRVT